MKKIFVVLALLSAMVLMISCSGGSSDIKTGSLYEKCYPNETCNKGLICDIENNVCVKDWCKSNNDCTDPEYPVCNTKTGNCESPDGRKPGDESDSDSDTQDSENSSDDSSDSDSDSGSDSDADSEPTDTGSDSGDSTDDVDSSDSQDDTGDSTDDGDSSADTGDDGDTDSDDDANSTPCNPNPCTSISNSTGVCTVSGTGYICGCNSGYTWNGGSCQSNGGSSLPECSSSTTSFPCKDSSTGYIWSAKNTDGKTWQQAKDHCTGLNTSNYGGFSSRWHLPRIDELGTLLIASRVSANCAVSRTNGCLSAMGGCWSCSTCTQTGTQSSSDTTCSDWGTSYSDGRYSKFGDTGKFWSSSPISNDTYNAWYVDFSYGYVSFNSKTGGYFDVRCVREGNISTVN